MKILVFTLLAILAVVYSSELPCNCRLGNLNRIVNGQIASNNLIPWMVSLADTNGNHFCGATILNENYVLTAAHCTEGMNGYEIMTRVGIHDTSKVRGDRLHFGKRIVQANYKSTDEIGDFALIELMNPIRFVPGEVEPGCLNLKDKDFEGDLLSSGWGLTDRPWADADDESMKLHSSPKNTTELKFYFSTQFDLGCKDHNICLLAKNKGDSVCNGDSGGPLMHTKNGKTSVVGMASYVTGLEEGKKLYFCNGFTTYARLSLYKDLIDQNVGDYCTV